MINFKYIVEDFTKRSKLDKKDHFNLELTWLNIYEVK